MAPAQAYTSNVDWDKTENDTSIKFGNFEIKGQNGNNK